MLLSAQGALWLALAVTSIGVLLYEWRRYHNSESVLLTLWLGGTLVFAGYFNHYVNARVLLPLAPALVILVLRNLNIDSVHQRRWMLGTTCVALGAATLYLAAADYRLAHNGRRAAQEALDAAGGTNVWFTGHWGFQYYMEQGGAAAVDFETWAWEGGDLLVMPKFNGQSLSFPEVLIQRYEIRAYPVLQGVTTLNREVGAGFYADSIGPLPYIIGPAVAEQYGLVWLKPRN